MGPPANGWSGTGEEKGRQGSGKGQKQETRPIHATTYLVVICFPEHVDLKLRGAVGPGGAVLWISLRIERA